MEKIPFDLEKYNTGEYDVVTRNGYPARIICESADSPLPIIVLVRNPSIDASEEVHQYDVTGFFSGRLLSGRQYESFDLFLIPKEKQEPKKEEKPINIEKFDKICGYLGLFTIKLYALKSSEQYEEQINTIAKKILEITDDK